MHVHRSWPNVHVVLPGGILQLFARYNLLSVIEQVMQQPEFGEAEMNVAAVSSNPIHRHIHFDIGIGDQPVFDYCSLNSKQGTKMLQQLGGDERSGKTRVDAVFQEANMFTFRAVAD